MANSSGFLDRMELLQNTLIVHATQDSYPTGDYEELRNELLANEEVSPLAPEFVVKCRTLSHFWQFIKNRFGTYAERREFLWDSFAPLLNYLEQKKTTPSDVVVEAALASAGSSFISSEWKKCLDRRAVDPEAAITSARSLLETVLKHILDETSTAWGRSDDLPSLYKKAAKALNLAPEQHSEEVFRQILGGMTTVVNGFAGLRNRYGDSHGKEKRYVRPAERHAKFAVGLAGVLAAFLLETLEARTEET